MIEIILLVSGSRECHDIEKIWRLIHETVTKIYVKLKRPLASTEVIFKIIFGDARGVACATHCYCHINNIDHDEPHILSWVTYGKAAGPIRNEAMVKKCTHGICIGSTKGTSDTARRLKKAGKLVRWYK